MTHESEKIRGSAAGILCVSCGLPMRWEGFAAGAAKRIVVCPNGHRQLGNVLIATMGTEH